MSITISPSHPGVSLDVSGGMRMIVGDLSDSDRVIVELQLLPKEG